MRSRIKALLAALVLSLLPLAAYAQTPIQLGETGKPGIADSGNGNLLAAQGPYALTQAATIQTISFYVTTASGQLRLGLETSGPNNDCRAGTLKAQTDAFTPSANAWNAANVVTQVNLPTGNYCLEFLPSSNSLGFLKGITQGVREVNHSRTFGPLPTTFPSNPGGDQYHWGLYATLLPPAPPTLQMSFNPPTDAVPSNAPIGTVITKPVVGWSNGAPFTGTLSFSQPPYFADGGCVAFDGNLNVVVNCDLSGDVNTQQNFTVTATQ